MFIDITDNVAVFVRCNFPEIPSLADSPAFLIQYCSVCRHPADEITLEILYSAIRRYIANNLAVFVIRKTFEISGATKIFAAGFNNVSVFVDNTYYFAAAVNYALFIVYIADKHAFAVKCQFPDFSGFANYAVIFIQNIAVFINFS